jgi:hypothetical protein
MDSAVRRFLRGQAAQERANELMQEVFRREAEQKQAPVIMRDLLIRLVVGQERAQRWLIGLTAALVIETAAVIVLTIALVLE